MEDTLGTLFHRLLRFALKFRIRKALRRRAWEEHRTRHGWAEEELVPPHAFRAFLLCVAAILFFQVYEGRPDGSLAGVFLSLSAVSGVGAFLFFLLDLDAPRQNPFHQDRT